MFRKTINPSELAVKLKMCLTAIDERGIKLLKATFWLQIVVNSNIEKSRDLIYFLFYCYNDKKNERNCSRAKLAGGTCTVYDR